MGSFAFLRKPTEASYSVDECHINLWSLSGFLGRRVFFFDVGAIISVEDPEKSISEINISLPFRSLGTRNEWHDLSSNMSGDADTTQLVFGRATRVDETLIVFGEVPPQGANAEPAPVKPPIRIVSISNAKLIQEGNDPQHWRLTFAEPIRQDGTGERMYFRVRFVTRRPERMWTWMNGKTVAIGDLRIGDTREILAKQSRAALRIIESWFVPIQNLRLFLIVPCNLVYRISSPEAHYIRMFEGEVWRKYLDRRVNLFSNAKLMIYQWRNKDEKPIDIKNRRTEAFKAFIVLSKQFSLLFWTAIVALFVCGMLYGGAIWTFCSPFLVNALKPAVEQFTSYWPQLGIGGIVLGVLVFIYSRISRVKNLPQIVDTARRVTNTVEDAIYKLAGKIY